MFGAATLIAISAMYPAFAEDSTADEPARSEVIAEEVAPTPEPSVTTTAPAPASGVDEAPQQAEPVSDENDSLLTDLQNLEDSLDTGEMSLEEAWLILAEFFDAEELASIDPADAVAIAEAMLYLRDESSLEPVKLDDVTPETAVEVAEIYRAGDEVLYPEGRATAAESYQNESAEMQELIPEEPVLENLSMGFTAFRSMPAAAPAREFTRIGVPVIHDFTYVPTSGYWGYQIYPKYSADGYFIERIQMVYPSNRFPDIQSAEIVYNGEQIVDWVPQQGIYRGGDLTVSEMPSESNPQRMVQVLTWDLNEPIDGAGISDSNPIRVHMEAPIPGYNPRNFRFLDRSGFREVSRITNNQNVTLQYDSSPSYVNPDGEYSGNPNVAGAFDSGDWTVQVEQPIPNPAPIMRCGQNIAFAVDVSNSLIDNDGIQQVRTALNRTIDALAGTPSSVTIYTFATEAPARNNIQRPGTYDLSTSAGVAGAKREVQSIKFASGSQDGRGAGSQYGGTNWEGALQLAQGKGHDTVYFVTDGMPTANQNWNSEWRPENTGGAEALYRGTDGSLYRGWGNGANRIGGDTGIMAHEQDIANAIRVANQIKREGTRIEGIGVNLSGDPYPLLKEAAMLQLHGIPASLDTSDGIPEENEQWPNAPLTEPRGTFTDWDDRQGRRSRQFQNQTRSPIGFWTGASGEHLDFAGYPKGSLGRQNVGPANEQAALEALGFKVSDEEHFQYRPPQTRASQTIRFYGESLVGYKSREETLWQISDRNPTLVANTSALAEALAELVLAACQGTVVIQKDIEGLDPDDPEYSLSGWLFEGSRVDGNFTLNGTGQDRATVQTDAEGSAMFQLNNTDDQQVNGTMRIREMNSDVATMNAPRCYRNDANNTPVAVQVDPDDPNAFTIPTDFTGVQAYETAIIHCEVTNVFAAGPGIIGLTKVDNNGNPLTGAEFALYQVDENGAHNAEAPIAAMSADDLANSGLEPQAGVIFYQVESGNYLLFETRSPSDAAGNRYSLLPRPVTFTVTQEGDDTSVELTTPADIESGENFSWAPLVEVSNPGSSSASATGPPIIQVANLTSGELPKTGGRGVTPYAAMGLILLAVAYGASRRNPASRA